MGECVESVYTCMNIYKYLYIGVCVCTYMHICVYVYAEGKRE